MTPNDEAKRIEGPANGPRDQHCPPHEPSGWVCGVAHLDGVGGLLPACEQCKKCLRYIRPEKMNDPVIVIMCERCEAQPWVEFSSVKGYRCGGCRNK